GFELFESQFGVPCPYEKYDQLFVAQVNAGAMENAGAATFVEAYVFRSKPAQARVERRAITVLHELAHMWFGDLVTMR
ncbi:M1 family aminopeptidase, partial [Pseudomonas syringae pv. tagetis]|uniref:M1 family aminopeptidase n=1 Tax=Pseudomonas syringae group genomosp. 7 TaxID=251699 RepID=UPI0037705E87